jgi:aryl-alcohol dehydrogenase-like predicted oxidoreductase
MSEKEALLMVKGALDQGINFFDTAPIYGHGTSEERLGKALKDVDRSKVVINTKFGHTETGATNFEASDIRRSLEGSLKRLQMDHVDSLIIHNPPRQYLDGNRNDHYEILERLKEEGKIGAFGASLDFQEEMDLFMNTTGAEVIEAFFNILHQDAANSFDLAKKKGVAIIVKIPLDSGWLTGKYDEESIFHDVRGRWSRDDIWTRARLVQEVKEIIGHEQSLSQVAMSFCLAYDAVTTVIPGNVSTAQLESNLRSVDLPISAELREKLERFYQDEVKDLGLPW